MNSILIIMIIVCLSFAVLNILGPYDPIGVLENAMASATAIVALIYFHKTDKLKLSTNITVVLFLLAMAAYLNVTQNTNYAFCWIATLPPVLFFLLGTKKAPPLIGLSLCYFTYFVLSNRESWGPSEFNTESILNIAGVTLSLMAVVYYYETSRKEALRSLIYTNSILEDSKDEINIILNTAAEGIYGIDVEGNCTFCNKTCLELLGYKDEKELIGKGMHFLVRCCCGVEAKTSDPECDYRRTLLSGEKVYNENEMFRRADGTCFEVAYYSNPKFKNNQLVGAVITFIDISSRKKYESKIQYLSCHDSLTDLINRQCFMEEFKWYDKKEFLPISVIFGDLDGLKLTNDIFGHAVGDNLILKVANVIKTTSRKGDVVARIGGDEFVWLMPNTDSNEAQKVVDRIKTFLEKEEPYILKCDMSMGFYTKSTLDQSLDETLVNAENEMYREKVAHRKNYKIGILSELTTALHTKSTYDSNHAKNTSRLCEMTASALNWTDAEIKNISDAGYYHDIGKVVLKEELLNKQTELNPVEVFEKQQHPVIGYRIMNLFDNTLDLAESIYSHHERWNGSGYPKGLAGEQIPIQSRIIALAEHYDHLRNHRPEHAFSMKEAISRIKELSGVHYDPNLVDVFVIVAEAFENEKIGA